MRWLLQYLAVMPVRTNQPPPLTPLGYPDTPIPVCLAWPAEAIELPRRPQGSNLRQASVANPHLAEGHEMAHTKSIQGGLPRGEDGEARSRRRRRVGRWRDQQFGTTLCGTDPYFICPASRPGSGLAQQASNIGGTHAVANGRSLALRFASGECSTRPPLLAFD